MVLYRINKDNTKFWIADPARGKYKCNQEELKNHWVVSSNNEEKGIVMCFERSEKFYEMSESSHDSDSLRFIWNYFNEYKKYLFQISLGLGLGCILQLILPFLTQWIVDIGIRHKDINFIWLILLGELMIIVGRTAADFIKRWILLHISMRVNISLVSDFFIKLIKLPMSFFDTRMIGDILQRLGDHKRVETFLTNQVLGIIFTFLSFIVFGTVLFLYNKLIFIIFIISSIAYGIWVACFLYRRKVLDYELFAMQSLNQNKTYQFITSMQEIKLQNCGRRRRWEWEDSQADLFNVEMKVMKLQQVQEAGGIFINEVKNILITVFAATAVIDGKISLGAMLAIQYIVGQLNSPMEQIMTFMYSLQDVKISLERINEIHNSKEEESSADALKSFPTSRTIEFLNVDFKYNRHSLKNTLTNISFTIPEGKVTAIVGASGSGKTTLIKLLLGYYPVLNGSLKIGDFNLNHYDLEWWRSNCGVVMQEGVIFSESIERNIAIDEDDIDIPKIEEAARIASIHEYITSLPLKYKTKIGKGGKGLSQGQKQRILI